MTIFDEFAIHVIHVQNVGSNELKRVKERFTLVGNEFQRMKERVTILQKSSKRNLR